MAGGIGPGPGDTPLASVVTLLPGAEVWTPLASLPRGLAFVHASVVGETLRLTGGQDDANSPRAEVIHELLLPQFGAMHSRYYDSKSYLWKKILAHGRTQ